MSSELPWYLPVILGLAVGVLVWALLSAKARKNRGQGK